MFLSFVFFDPPPAFFLFLDEPFELFIPLEREAESGSIPFIDMFPPGVDVGVAACDGVVCADEGPGESYDTEIIVSVIPNYNCTFEHGR